MAHRERVVSLKKEGHSYKAISEQLSLSCSNVRDIWTRYRKQGEAGLATAYANCGPKGPKTPPLLRRAALWLKRQHPAWGTPRIHCGLRSRYGDATPASVRSTAGMPPKVWSSRAAETRVSGSGRPGRFTTSGRSTLRRTWCWPTGSRPAT